MSIDGISITDGSYYITVLGFETLIEHRFHTIQQCLIQMLKSGDKDEISAALFLIDRAQGQFATIKENSLKKLIQLGFVNKDAITDAAYVTGHMGFRKAYPEEKGYLRGYAPLYPFPRNPRLDPKPDDVLKGMNQHRTVLAVGQADTMNLKGLVSEQHRDHFRSYHKPGTIIVFYRLKNGDIDHVLLKQWQKWAKDARVILKDNAPPSTRSEDGFQQPLFTGLSGVTLPSRPKTASFFIYFSGLHHYFE